MNSNQWAEWVAIMGIATSIVVVAYGVYGTFGP